MSGSGAAARITSAIPMIDQFAKVTSGLASCVVVRGTMDPRAHAQPVGSGMDLTARTAMVVSGSRVGQELHDLVHSCSLHPLPGVESLTRKGVAFCELERGRRSACAADGSAFKVPLRICCCCPFDSPLAVLPAVNVHPKSRVSRLSSDNSSDQPLHPTLEQYRLCRTMKLDDGMCSDATSTRCTQLSFSRRDN